ncbi:MAG: hypothetical protein H7Y20_03230 [Bryobacteraceae bacterium]|nr:hypothetical protein [Bryobacteraceae bacterium]
MATKSDSNVTRIPMQVHTELHIKKGGEISVSNPSIGLGPNDLAASAVISYRFDPATGDHVIRLEEPMSHDLHEDDRRPMADKL